VEYDDLIEEERLYKCSLCVNSSQAIRPTKFYCLRRYCPSRRSCFQSMRNKN